MHFEFWYNRMHKTIEYNAIFIEKPKAYNVPLKQINPNETRDLTKTNRWK